MSVSARDLVTLFAETFILSLAEGATWTIQQRKQECLTSNQTHFYSLTENFLILHHLEREIFFSNLVNKIYFQEVISPSFNMAPILSHFHEDIAFFCSISPYLQ